MQQGSESKNEFALEVNHRKYINLQKVAPTS